MIQDENQALPELAAAAARDEEPGGSGDAEGNIHASADGAAPPSALEERLRAALAERDARQQDYLRALADLENFRKRVRKEQQEERRFAVLPLVESLLPVVDNLRRALEAPDAARQDQAWLTGVQLVARQLDDALARHGVEPINAVGTPFDPNLHLAIKQLPTSESPPMTVLIEAERGYKLHDRVIRPSTVIVAAPPAENACEKE
jgi:molecular chaperone GrpE